MLITTARLAFTIAVVAFTIGGARHPKIGLVWQTDTVITCVGVITPIERVFDDRILCGDVQATRAIVIRAGVTLGGCADVRGARGRAALTMFENAFIIREARIANVARILCAHAVVTRVDSIAAVERIFDGRILDRDIDAGGAVVVLAGRTPNG